MSPLPISTSTEDIEGLLVLLLRDGSRSDAVTLYQEETGADREQAERVVADLARRHNISSMNWPAAVAVAAAVLGAITLAIFFR
ncbi:MAG: hypothetical protein RIC55_08470 [Pirellulaceae bacterium]